MLKTELKAKFAYVSDPVNMEFSPVFLTASFLSPVHRVLLSAEQLEIVEAYLRALVVGPRSAPDIADVTFSIPGSGFYQN